MTIDLICLIGAGVLMVVAVACAVVAWRRETALIAISATPVSSAATLAARHQQARAGQGRLGEAVSISGTVECDEPLCSPYSATLCVAYDYYRSETTGEEPPLLNDEHKEQGYHFNDHDRRCVPRFRVRDASGTLLVDPTGAELDLKESGRRFEQYSGGGRERELWHEERSLALGAQAYVLGYLSSEQGEPVVTRHPLDRSKRFLISYRDTRTLTNVTRARAYGLYLAGGLAGGIAIVLLVVVFML